MRAQGCAHGYSLKAFQMEGQGCARERTGQGRGVSQVGSTARASSIPAWALRRYAHRVWSGTVHVLHDGSGVGSKSG